MWSRYISSIALSAVTVTAAQYLKPLFCAKASFSLLLILLDSEWDGDVWVNCRQGHER